ncbi:hypothetical protein CF319_g6063 [Tilletia indica]|nr:hypothetical protein CF319_g6063 [Tilletia indica]
MTIKARIQQLWAAREEEWQNLKAGVAAASAFSASIKKEEGGSGGKNCCGHGHGCGSDGVRGLGKEVESLKEEVRVGMAGQSARIASTEQALATALVGTKEGLKELAEVTRKRQRNDDDDDNEKDEGRSLGRVARAVVLHLYGALARLVEKTGRRYHTKAAIREEAGALGVRIKKTMAHNAINRSPELFIYNEDFKGWGLKPLQSSHRIASHRIASHRTYTYPENFSPSTIPSLLHFPFIHTFKKLV